jgi:hypothetical protein
MRLMASKEYAKACPKFEASQRLDPGMGTQYNLADCYEKIGRTASAWALFIEVADQALKSGDTKRERVARSRAQAAAQRVSHVVVRIPYPVPGLVITEDGAALAEAMWAAALPVDPGPHHIEAFAPGKRAWERTIEVGADGGTVEVDVPSLQDQPGTRARTLAVPSAVPRISPPTASPAMKPAGSAQRTWALVSGGIGIASIGVGIALAVSARSTYASANCDASNQCAGQRDVKLRDQALARADLANLPWAVGLLGVGLGVTLWFTAPAAARGRPSTGLSVSPREVSLGGRF